EQRYPLLLQLRQRGVDVLDLEADVVQPALALGDQARMPAVGLVPGDQLDHGLTDGIESERADIVRLDAAKLAAKAALPQLPARFRVPHYHADVLDALDLHALLLTSDEQG